MFNLVLWKFVTEVSNEAKLEKDNDLDFCTLHSAVKDGNKALSVENIEELRLAYPETI